MTFLYQQICKPPCTYQHTIYLQISYLQVIVLGAIGIDPQGLALIIAIDRPLDMLRTVVNVTGDATVASVVASTEGEIIKFTDDE